MKIPLDSSYIGARCATPSFWLCTQFGMMQQNIVSMNNITSLCRPKRLRIRNLLALKFSHLKIS